MTVLHFNAHWMIENPLSSMVWVSHKWVLQNHNGCFSCDHTISSDAAKIMYHPRMAAFLHHCQHFLAKTHLGMFGGGTAKPIRLWSSSNFIQHLQRPLIRSEVPRSNATRSYLKDGKRRFTGTRHLKATQAYPDRFGRQAQRPAYFATLSWIPTLRHPFTHRIPRCCMVPVLLLQFILYILYYLAGHDYIVPCAHVS